MTLAVLGRSGLQRLREALAENLAHSQVIEDLDSCGAEIFQTISQILSEECVSEMYARIEELSKQRRFRVASETLTMIMFRLTDLAGINALELIREANSQLLERFRKQGITSAVSDFEHALDGTWALFELADRHPKAVAELEQDIDRYQTQEDLGYRFVLSLMSAMEALDNPSNHAAAIPPICKHASSLATECFQGLHASLVGTPREPILRLEGPHILEGSGLTEEYEDIDDNVLDDLLKRTVDDQGR